MAEHNGNGNWEREVLQNLLMETLTEQRRARRWKIFFRLLGVGLIVLFVVYGWFGSDDHVVGKGLNGPHVAVVEVNGVIAAGNRASADNIMEGMRNAFKDRNTRAVVLRINSPGGSPVQAGQVYDEIRRLRAKYPAIPLYAVVDDLGASGGYYIASGADRIYVDKASLIGSIGVIMDGFGFTGAMEKVGIERRMLTAGANKGFLDPFSPVNPEQQAYAKTMLAQIHAQFIDVVRKGRGKRLKETPDMFSGLIWSGEQSIKLGLADGLGSLDSVARDIVKTEEVVDFTPKEDWSSRFAKGFGMGASSHVEQMFTGRLR